MQPNVSASTIALRSGPKPGGSRQNVALRQAGRHTIGKGKATVHYVVLSSPPFTRRALDASPLLGLPRALKDVRRRLHVVLAYQLTLRRPVLEALALQQRTKHRGTGAAVHGCPIHHEHRPVEGARTPRHILVRSQVHARRVGEAEEPKAVPFVVAVAQPQHAFEQL
eukprot:6962572-Prymnesium_polylepis.1